MNHYFSKTENIPEVKFETESEFRLKIETSHLKQKIQELEKALNEKELQIHQQKSPETQQHLPDQSNQEELQKDSEPESKTNVNELKQKISQLEKAVEDKELQIRRQKFSKNILSRSDEGPPEKVLESQSANEILSKEIELYEKKIRDIEEEKQKMYLIMFKKGQQAAKLDIEEVRYYLK